QLLDHAGINLGGFAGIGQHALFGVVEGDDVDIGGGVELLPAMLTEGEDGEARIGCRGLLGGGGQQALFGGAARQQGQGRVECGVDDIGRGGGGLGRGPGAGGFGDGGEQRRAALGNAEKGGELFRRGGGGIFDGVDVVGEGASGAVSQGGDQPVGIVRGQRE